MDTILYDLQTKGIMAMPRGEVVLADNEFQSWIQDSMEVR